MKWGHTQALGWGWLAVEGLKNCDFLSKMKTTSQMKMTLKMKMTSKKKMTYKIKTTLNITTTQKPFLNIP